MAPARCPARALLLAYASLLAAAVGLGSPEPALSGRQNNLLAAMFQESPVEQTHGLSDPRDAWMLFVRQSDKGVNSKRGSRSKAKKLKLGLPGPPGPPGPQGPPGPITPPEVLLKEFQLLLKGTGAFLVAQMVKNLSAMQETQIRYLGHEDPLEEGLATHSSILAWRIPWTEEPGAVRTRECAEPEPCPRVPAAVPAARPEDDEEAAAGGAGVLALLAAPLDPGPRAPRVEAAFHCRLRRDASVERRALHELGLYYVPDAEGAFRRGPGLNLTSGQYTAPVAGFYALAATLHVELKAASSSSSPGFWRWPVYASHRLTLPSVRCHFPSQLSGAAARERSPKLQSLRGEQLTATTTGPSERPATLSKERPHTHSKQARPRKVKVLLKT
ncbi:hypothetical protein MG293_002196 [Ovis ammon polii]|uniref:C1q domain-containing protein n=1 Tax=Ovis ammon polii TaxID=230172 RepID=A0AAD4YJK1_OVIAM|nr:hypothetical protein MG293_002196 [Ovis ammon polii]